MRNREGPRMEPRANPILIGFRVEVIQGYNLIPIREKVTSEENSFRVNSVVKKLKQGKLLIYKVKCLGEVNKYG